MSHLLSSLRRRRLSHPQGRLRSRPHLRSLRLLGRPLLLRRGRRQGQDPTPEEELLLLRPALEQGPELALEQELARVLEQGRVLEQELAQAPGPAQAPDSLLRNSSPSRESLDCSPCSVSAC